MLCEHFLPVAPGMLSFPETGLSSKVLEMDVSSLVGMCPAFPVTFCMLRGSCLWPGVHWMRGGADGHRYRVRP